MQNPKQKDKIINSSQILHNPYQKLQVKET